MCIATRARKPYTQLLRVVARSRGDHSIILPDPLCREQGRGAWIEPTHEAYTMAMKKNAFKRALRIHQQVDSSAVRKYIEDKRKTEH